MEETITVKEYLRALLEGLVQHQDSIEIEETTDDRGLFVTLKVAKEDMSVVIGKEGATIRAIKRILWAYGAKESIKIGLKVLEPEE